MNIGRDIRHFRKKANLTQQELANKANMHRNAIAQYEAGTRTPNAKYLSRIANALGVTVNDFFSVVPEKCTEIPMPQVKEPKKSIGSLTVDVGINSIDETIKQLQTLKKLYTDIDTLQQRIIKGSEKIRVAQAYNVNIEVVDKQINADDFIKQFEEAIRSQYSAE